MWSDCLHCIWLNCKWWLVCKAVSSISFPLWRVHVLTHRNYSESLSQAFNHTVSCLHVNILNFMLFHTYFILISCLFLHLLAFCSVIRFTREEILALRKTSKVLSSMTEFPDIISVTALGPETLRPLEQDEVSIFTFIIIFCFILYCIVLYCIVLYCIVLYCIVLYCTDNDTVAS